MDLNRLYENDSAYPFVASVLERYRRDKQAGGARAIDSYLADVAPEFHALLLPEMIRIELHDSPTSEIRRELESYCERFPEHEEAIASLLPSFDVDDTLPGASSDSTPCQSVGPYELIRKLGQGGMGVVWLAHQDKPVKRDVAIKLMHEAFATEHHIGRFEAERQALALMDHPHIAKVLDGGEAPNGRPYYAMELIDGLPFAQYCDDHQLVVKARIRLFLLVCRAIEHAHQKAIIHRDLKPSNVLVVTQDGEAVPRVIDFGLAKAIGHQLTDREANTEFGQQLGTLKYMSPEQADARGEIDTRTDVYSLGVMLYEALTGTTPLDAHRQGKRTFSEALEAIRRIDPPAPSRLVGDALIAPSLPSGSSVRDLQTQLRGDIDAIVMKAIEKSPSRRYASVAEFADDLERYLRHNVVKARPASALYRARKFVKRHRTAVTTFTVVVLSLVITSVISTTQLIRANEAIEERDLAISAKDQALQQREQALTQEQKAKLLADSRYEESEATIDFVTEKILRFGSPDASPHRNISLREVIDRAANNIENDPDVNAHPLVEARLHLTLGQVYLTLSELPAAHEHLNRARALLDRQDNGDPRLRLNTIHTLGELHRIWGNVAEADKLLTTAHTRRLALFGKSDADTLESVTSLTALYIDDGRFSDAEPLILNGIDACWGETTPARMSLLAALMNNAGMLHHALGKFEEAVKRYSQFLDMDHGLRPTDPGVMTIRGNLAFAYADQGKLDQAEEVLLDLMRVQEEVLGKRSVEYLRSRNNLLTIREERGATDLTSEFEQLLAEMDEVAGPDSLASIVVRSNLGNRYAEQNRVEEARRELTRVLQERIKLFGAHHPKVAFSMCSVADLELEIRNLDEADRLYKQALAIYQSHYTDDNALTLGLKQSLGQMMQVRRDYAGAEATFKEIAEKSSDIFSPDHAMTLAARMSLGNLYNIMQRWEPAAEILEDVYHRSKKSKGPTSPGTLRALAGWTNATRYFAFDRSKPLADELMQASSELPREHPVRLDALEIVALVTSGVEGKKSQAVALAMEAYEIQRDVLGENSNRTLRALNVLSQCYATNAQPGEAAECVRKLADGARQLPGTPPELIQSFEDRHYDLQREYANQALSNGQFAASEEASRKWLEAKFLSSDPTRFEVLAHHVQSLRQQQRIGDAETAIRSRIDEVLAQTSDRQDNIANVERMYGLLIDDARRTGHESAARFYNEELRCMVRGMLAGAP